MDKRILFILIFGLSINTVAYSQDLSNVNVLMYTGAVSWMSLEDANLQSQMTRQLLSSKGIQAEIVQNEDSVRDWMLQTTSDGNVDVLILYGTLPISIYPPFNSQPDGSVAENWIESTDGNTILNHGDYFGFWAGGNQEELGGQNGIQALQAIMDIPHITMWDFGLENNTPMIVTKDGKEVTPSLTNFKSDRAFHLDELTGNWFAEKVLASDTGTSQATRADPIVVRDGNRGRIGIVYQTFNEVNPKGKVVAELIANFLLGNNHKISVPSVERIPVKKEIRLVYFRPTDKLQQRSIDIYLSSLVKAVQQFYFSQIGDKTFEVEEDTQGNIVIHHVTGRHNDTYYHLNTSGKVLNEIEGKFDVRNQIYLIAVDISADTFCGVGARVANGGFAIIPASGTCFNTQLTAHELGHAFGLYHDFRDPAYVMGYGTQTTLSYEAIEWLSIHPYFNSPQSPQSNNPTTSKLLSFSPPLLKFQANDLDGLHQVQLIIPTTENDPATGDKLREAKTFNSSTHNEFSFSVNGLSADTVTLQTIDTLGNISNKSFHLISKTETPADMDTVVSISPSTAVSPAVGEQVVFTVKITSRGTVAGYQATMQFDTTALRFVSGANGDYLPAGAFFVDPKVEGNLVKLNAASLAGESDGDGTLATLTFEVITAKASTLTLSDVLLSNRAGETFLPQIENAEITEPTKLKGDVNGDGTVNIADLVLVASNLGETGQNTADVNGDGQVNIADLVLVAGALGNNAAAPSLNPQASEMLAATDVKQWLSAAQQLNLRDTTSLRGILFLQKLLVTLIPKETALLANYPNPFNPETWIPYQLAKPVDVTLHIYSVNGVLVRALALGYQPAGMYQHRSRAAYWDGKNAFGERVASGVYFYTLTAGDFTATRKMLILK